MEQIELLRQSSESVSLEKPPSLIKWTGSKRTISSQIFELRPKQFESYFEPFLGSGAVLYAFGGKVKSEASDIYSPLVEIWREVKASPESLADWYEKEWTKLQENFPDHYYVVRDRFNNRPNGRDLFFLGRTCVNGIIRFNSDGKFNNSIHLSRRGMEPARFRAILLKWHSTVSKTEFYSRDYRDIVARVKKNDFVYLDPPYLWNKQRYINGIEPSELWSFLDKLNSKDVSWALSLDGSRGDHHYEHVVPRELFKKHHAVNAGLSAVSRVLNKKIEQVIESVYCNY